MVNFNDSVNIASSPHDILKQIIIQRHCDLIEAIESFQKMNDVTDASTIIIKARTYSLFLQTRAMIKRSITPEDFQKLTELVKSNNYDDLDQAFEIIDTVLDEKNITKSDFMSKKKKTHRSEEADRLA